MRFVFDTNTLVSALVTPTGITASLLRAVLHRHRLIVSPEMVMEYTEVMIRPDFTRAGSVNERMGWLRDVLSMPACLAVRPLIRVAVVADDPSDDRFLEAAVWTQADYLVSGDAHLLALKQIRNPHLRRAIPIVAPNARDMLRLLPALRPPGAAPASGA